MSTDIPIKYINATGSVDFQVVAFTRDYTDPPNDSNSNSTDGVTVITNDNDMDYKYVAWQVFNAETEVDFVYPSAVYVGMYYKTGILTMKAGPFRAKLGSSWEIVQPETPDEVTILQEIKDLESDPNGAITIKNMPPKTWSGRSLTVGIYKAGYPLLVHKDLHIGGQTQFIIKPTIFFGVIQNLKTSETFTSSQLTRSALYEFDLNYYPNGLIVTLNEAPGGGEYSFSGMPTSI